MLNRSTLLQGPVRGAAAGQVGEHHEGPVQAERAGEGAGGPGRDEEHPAVHL